MLQNFNLLLFILASYHIVCVGKKKKVQNVYKILNQYSNCFYLPKHSFCKGTLHLLYRYFILKQRDFSDTFMHISIHEHMSNILVLFLDDIFLANSCIKPLQSLSTRSFC